MTKLLTPPVTELALAPGSSLDEMVCHFLAEADMQAGLFNYLSANRAIKSAYKGLHSESQLLQTCLRENTKQGLKANQEVVSLAAPLAFGRSTQVFDLSLKQFQFGRSLHSAYRISFFYVEDGKVVLYFLQPRKHRRLTLDQFGMIATIHKRYLLDTEFYGQAADVEYVDVSAPNDKASRKLKRHRLSDLELWPEERLADRLTMIAKALEIVNESGMLAPRRRQQRPPAQDLPLFD